MSVSMQEYNVVDFNQGRMEAASTLKKNNKESGDELKFLNLIRDALDSNGQENQSNLSKTANNNGQSLVGYLDNPDYQVNASTDKSKVTDSTSDITNEASEDVKKKSNDELLTIIQGLLSRLTCMKETQKESDAAANSKLNNLISILGSMYTKLQANGTTAGKYSDSLNEKLIVTLDILAKDIEKNKISSDAENNAALGNLIAQLQNDLNISSTSKLDASKQSNDIDSLKRNLSEVLADFKNYLAQNKVDSGNSSQNSVLENLIQQLQNELNTKETAKLETLKAGNNNGTIASEDGDDLKRKLVEILVTLDNDMTQNKLSSGDNCESIELENLRKLIDKLQDGLKKGEANKASDLKLDNKLEIDVKKVLGAGEEVKKSVDNSNTNKEEKFLKNIIGGEDDNKLNKVSTFLSQMNSLKDDVNSTAISTPEKLIVSKNSITQDIVKVIKYMNLNDLKELTVKVNPKELGEIVIKLTMEDGNMRANISAHNKDTYNLLSSNLVDLTKSLSNSELKIQNVNINVYQEDTTFFNESFNQGNRQQNSRRESKALEDIVDKSNSQGDIKIDENNLNKLI